MSSSLKKLQSYLTTALVERVGQSDIAVDELTVDVPAVKWLEVARFLRDDPKCRFEQLTDLCGVDFLSYGDVEWESKVSSFSRGVDAASSGRFDFDSQPIEANFEGQRFAVVVHLLSVALNQRLRVRVFCESNDFPQLDSVVEIWSSANWYEREAFDLYGILFKGHPDLRRILTDYGFVGHPFRKDFPLSGHVEMRYDEEKERVVYEPVTIDPRVLVPRVVRDDKRFSSPEESSD